MPVQKLGIKMYEKMKVEQRAEFKVPLGGPDSYRDRGGFKLAEIEGSNMKSCGSVAV